MHHSEAGMHGCADDESHCWPRSSALALHSSHLIHDPSIYLQLLTHLHVHWQVASTCVVPHLIFDICIVSSCP